MIRGSAATRAKTDLKDLVIQLEAILKLAGGGSDEEKAFLHATDEWLAGATARELKASADRQDHVRRMQNFLKRKYHIVASPSELRRWHRLLSEGTPIIVSKGEALQVYAESAFRRFDIADAPSYCSITVPDRTIDLPERNFFRDARCMVDLAATTTGDVPLSNAVDPSVSDEELGKLAAPGFLLYAIEGLCRMAIVASCACVEAYIAGLGVDYVDHNPGLRPDLLIALREGQKKRRFLSLSERISLLARTISGQSPDPPLSREPFASFISKVVDFRNRIAHPASYKGLRLNTSKYLQRARLATDSSESVIRAVHRMLRGTREGVDNYIFWLVREDERKRPAWYAALIRSCLVEARSPSPAALFSDIGSTIKAAQR